MQSFQERKIMKLKGTVTGITQGRGRIVLVLETLPIRVDPYYQYADRCEIALADTATARGAFVLGRRVVITIEPNKA
jgi:hypothetical protein